jgi:hypothetical protein
LNLVTDKNHFPICEIPRRPRGAAPRAVCILP